MPDYPPIDALHAAVLKKNTNPPAGAAQPAVLRAQESLRRAYPKDMHGVEVQEYPMVSEDAFSNSLARVPLPLDKGLHGEDYPEQHIEMNPALGAVFADTDIRRTLAHELDHIRQGREQPILDRVVQHRLPYSQRPNEIAAEKAADTFEHDFADQPQTQLGYPVPRNRDFNPALKSLQDLFNRSRP